MKIELRGACPACGDDLEVLLTRFHPEFPSIEEARVRCRNGACGYTVWRPLDAVRREAERAAAESRAPGWDEARSGRS